MKDEDTVSPPSRGVDNSKCENALFQTEEVDISSLQVTDAFWGSYGANSAFVDSIISNRRELPKGKVIAVEGEHGTPEVIVGVDNRIKVPDTRDYPWRCVCALFMESADDRMFIGTGWFIAPRVVLTAAHCLYMTNAGGWVKNIDIIPGCNGSYRPFGTVSVSDQNAFRIGDGWEQSQSPESDFGIIVMPETQAYGDTLGWFGISSAADEHFNEGNFTLSGYPRDGGAFGSEQQLGTQWFHSLPIDELTDNQLFYKIDTYGGQSGSPIWKLGHESTHLGVGIHTIGLNQVNQGNRITSQVHTKIMGWVNSII